MLKQSQPFEMPAQSPDLPLSERLARVGVWALCLGVLARNLGPLKEGDEWMHLSIGRWMLNHSQLLPTPDPLVWNDRGGDLQHEWLSQILLAGTDALAGLMGLRLLRGILLALCAWLVAKILHRASQNWPTALAGVSLWWLVAQPHAAIRPHLFGWLFALLVLGLLQQIPQWNKKHWFLYTFLLLLWAQAHSSQIVAPLFLGLHTLDLLVTERRLDRQWTARTLIAGLVVPLQPCGFALLPYALRSPQVAQGLVDEWAPTWQADVWQVQPWVPITLILLLFLTLLAALPRFGPLDRPFPNLLPALLAAIEMLHTRRMTFFAWIPLTFLAPRSPVRLPAWAALVLALAVWLTVGRTAEVWPQKNYVPGNFPVEITPFLARTPLQGKLFNPDPWGGWLEYWLPPRELHAGPLPSTDGRMLMAGRQWALDSLQIQAHGPDAEKLLETHEISVLLQRRADWLQVRPLNPQQFALAWQDRTAVLLVHQDRFFAQNVQSICQFYRQNPEQKSHATWPVRLQAPAGQASPTDVPSVLELCAKE